MASHVIRFAEGDANSDLVSDPVSGTIGNVFTVDRACTVTHLAWRSRATNGNGSTMRLQLWRVSDGVLLTGTGNITWSGTDAWLTYDVADVVLQAGVKYIVSISSGAFNAHNSTDVINGYADHNHASGVLTSTVYGRAFTSSAYTFPTGENNFQEILLGFEAVSNDPPNTPTSLAPSGATGKNAQTMSAVVSDPNGDNVRAQFQISKDSTFGSFTGAGAGTGEGSTVASGSTSSFATSTLDGDSTYYLRARAVDAAGEVSGWTATQSFVTNRTPGAPGAWTSPTSAEVVNTTDLVEVAAASDPDGQTLTYDFDLSLDNGATWAAKRTKAAGVSFTYDYTNEAATTAAKWRSRAWDGLTYGGYSTSPTFTVEHNRAPSAATWVSPPDNTSLDRAQPQTLDWTFVDPDTGDGQTKYDIRHRLVGAASWTTTTVNTTSTQHTYAGNALAAGDYEFQVLTYDSQGVVATAWSASKFLTFASVPADLTITAPGSGSTVATPDSLLAWSAASQQSYQFRRLGDNAGVADVNTVYFDSGEVASGTARNAALSLPVNERYEHVQLRIKANGLFSAWVSVRILVSYTRPATPSLIVTALAAGTLIVARHPLGNRLTLNQASLETDATGWVATTNCAVARSTAQALVGVASLSLTASAAGAMTASTGPGRASVTAGEPYTAVASLRAAVTARSAVVGLRWYNQAGAVIGTADSPAVVDSTTAWTEARLPAAVAPAGAVGAQVHVSVTDATTAAGEVHYADRIGLLRDADGTVAWSAPTPAVESMDIRRRKLGESGDGFRHRDGVGLAPGASFIDRRAAHRTEYEYAVVARASNGTTAQSAWAG